MDETDNVSDGRGMRVEVSGFPSNAFALLLEVVYHIERKLGKMSAQDKKMPPRLKGYMRASERASGRVERVKRKAAVIAARWEKSRRSVFGNA